jgi:hypothetical protein
MAGLCCVVLIGAAAASAQEEYKSDPIDPAYLMPDATKFDKSNKEQKAELSRLEKATKTARSNSEDIVDNVLRGSAEVNSAKSEFDRYYNGLIFPAMTQFDDATLFNLGVQRETLLKTLRDLSNDSSARKHLTEELVFPYFVRIPGDAGYHPAVRLNAVLILGNLNRREAQRNVEPPQPLDLALRELVALATKAETPAYLRIGALAGILRHASIEGQRKDPAMDNSLRQQCIDLAIGLIEAPGDAAGGPPSDDVYWMRRQAVQILGALRSPGTDGKAVAALRKVLDDQTTPLNLAADAVKAYGTMAFASPEQADVPGAVKSIGKIVERFFSADVNSIEGYVARIKSNRLLESRATQTAGNDANAQSGDDLEGLGASGGGGSGKGGRRGSSAANPETDGVPKVDVPNYKLNDVRQRAKYIAFVARRALDGMAPRRRNEVKQPENLKRLADPQTAKIIEQIVAALDKVMEQADLAPVKAPAQTTQTDVLNEPPKPETNDERLRNSLKAGIASIKTALGDNPPAEDQPVLKSAIGG